MSLSIKYQGKKVNFQFSLDGYQLSLLGLSAVILSSLTWYLSNPVEKQIQQRVVAAKQDFSAQRAELNDMQQKTKSEIAALILKVGEMQGQVRRLNALGQRLAGAASIEQGEFNFDTELPVGGLSYNVETDSVVNGHDLLANMDTLRVQLNAKESQLDILESLILNHNIEEDSALYGRPIKTGWLSSYYGIRKDPFNGLPTMHKGIDFAGMENQEIYATGAGIVTWAGKRFGYGQMIEIDHGQGIKSRYGHNSKILVNVGDVVTRGQSISLMGSTGRSTGPHVHYEILKNGRQIDPLKSVYKSPKS